jgi:hypothetical protein
MSNWGYGGSLFSTIEYRRVEKKISKRSPKRPAETAELMPWRIFREAPKQALGVDSGEWIQGQPTITARGRVSTHLPLRNNLIVVCPLFPLALCHHRGQPPQELGIAIDTARLEERLNLDQ